MKTLHTRQTKSPDLIVRLLYKLERKGRYGHALAQVEDFWNDYSLFPDINSLEPELAAEMILRCGSLFGFYGHTEQIADAQETSKNLLTEARSRFLVLDNLAKAAECENYLALAYWRRGEYLEADTWIEESFSRNLPDSSLIRLYSLIVKSLILLAQKKHQAIIELLLNLEGEFVRFGDSCVKGDFYNNCGIAYKQLGDTSAALRFFELARNFHRQSGHKTYLGTVENNLAQLYKTLKRFDRAHAAIDNAARLFKQIKDHTREGFSLDTKAQIHFAEGDFAEALIVADRALAVLKKSENAAYLVETYLTKAKILLYLEGFAAAAMCLFDAVQIAKYQISEHAARKITAEFEVILTEKNAAPPDVRRSETDDLKLMLSGELAHLTDVQVVLMKDDELADYGLTEDSLAVIACGAAARGEPAAIIEKATGETLCGVYDCEYGVVCLTMSDGEIELFDESEVEILGRIVGVCEPHKNDDGTTTVRAIEKLNFQ